MQQGGAAAYDPSGRQRFALKPQLNFSRYWAISSATTLILDTKAIGMTKQTGTRRIGNSSNAVGKE